MSTAYGPSPAERARTVLACAAVPTIDIAGRVAMIDLVRRTR